MWMLSPHVLTPRSTKPQLTSIKSNFCWLKRCYVKMCPNTVFGAFKRHLFRVLGRCAVLALRTYPGLARTSNNYWIFDTKLLSNNERYIIFFAGGSQQNIKESNFCKSPICFNPFSFYPSHPRAHLAQSSMLQSPFIKLTPQKIVAKNMRYKFKPLIFFEQLSR